jgi:hypothetical protein
MAAEPEGGPDGIEPRNWLAISHDGLALMA